MTLEHKVEHPERQAYKASKSVRRAARCMLQATGDRQRAACSAPRAACSLKRKNGAALLMILFMLSILTATIFICSFAIEHEACNDKRHILTLQRIQQVKRALIGRLADNPGGKDIISCGGFINDYGEPNNLSSFDTTNFIPVLLDEPDLPAGPDSWRDWDYYDTAPNDYYFWAGYRVVAANEGYYLKIPQGQTGPADEFRDGWGYPIMVRFIDDADDNRIEIRSYGNDGQPDIGSPTDYRKDISRDFYWQRNVKINVKNNSGGNVTLTLKIIYPEKGIIKDLLPEKTESINDGGSKEFDFSPQKFPVGLRKIEILESGTIKQIKMLCLPPGANPYEVTINYNG